MYLSTKYSCPALLLVLAVDQLIDLVFFSRNHKLVPPKKIIKLNVYLMLRPNNYCVALLPIK